MLCVQQMTMKDFKLNAAFRQACQEDVQTNCKDSTEKYIYIYIYIYICDLLHQNESHVANTVFELADDKRQWGDIYHF